jgi:hypothetical protein
VFSTQGTNNLAFQLVFFPRNALCVAPAFKNGISIWSNIKVWAANTHFSIPRLGDRWHLDEVFLKINGRLHYLWRAVDQDGDVLDIMVQSRRDKKAAKKFFRKLLKGLRYVPRVMLKLRLAVWAQAICSRYLFIDLFTKLSLILNV